MGGELNVVGGRNCSGDGRPLDDLADGHGHGTHVAGTVGARDNDQGVVGVAPGVRLWSVRVLDSSGQGTVSGLICAIDWIVAWVDAHPDRRMVVNLSLGGADPYRAPTACSASGTSADPEHQAFCGATAKGVVFVVAAGNDSADTDLTIPARYDEVITVSAIADYDGLPGGLGSHGSCSWTTADDGFASFSNHGAAVDVAAPGVCIRSTSRTTVGGTLVMSGTSMATPHVTGGVARYLAHHGGATPTAVRQGIVAEGSSAWLTATDPDTSHEPLLAVEAADPVPDPTPSPTPTATPDPTPSPTPTPDATPSPAPTPTPDPTPSLEPAPTPPPPPAPAQPADGVAPVMTRVTLDAPVSLGTRRAATWRTRMRWSATDDVGVSSYEVQVRKGTSAWTRAYQGASSGRTLSLPLGRISIRVRASDAAGNRSTWRSVTRTALVTDLTTTTTRSRTTSWVADTHRSAAWSGTRYMTSTVDQRLTVRTDGRRIALVAQQGTSGGRIVIRVDGIQEAVVDLASSGTRDRRVVWSAAWPGRAVRTIEVRTLDSPGADIVWLDAVLTLR